MPRFSRIDGVDSREEDASCPSSVGVTLYTLRLIHMLHAQSIGNNKLNMNDANIGTTAQRLSIFIGIEGIDFIE